MVLTLPLNQRMVWRYLFTNGKQGIVLDIGIMLAKREIKKHGAKSQSTKLNNLIFGKYNTYFKTNNTEFDWLSSDSDEVDKYINDPYCGTIFTAGLF